ncbi:MAG TPA: prolyl oligopeptidase family serine peptidase [Acidimicrobiales bacterium]|nr:prolyl oligopeptidase family serine peptidase [Acidimicrobiales bacterium]
MTTADRPPADSFPRRSARTRRFTLGAPRTITVARDGSRVLFLRSGDGEDPVHALWSVDPDTGRERLLADPRALLTGAAEADLPAAERARRERARESGEGIVAYDADPDARRAVVALGGRLFLVDTDAATSVELDSSPGAFAPRLSPVDPVVAYVADGALRLVGADRPDTVLADDPDPAVTWGAAEFIAAEELQRSRGTWWSPDGTRVAAARVDETPVRRWYISHPVDPGRAPTEVRYPAAGTANADVSLHVLDLDGGRVDVEWDRERHPYLVTVAWRGADRLDVTLLTRDQRELVVLDVDAATGATSVALRHDDPSWIEVVPGVPARWGDRLVTAVDRDGARRLALEGEPFTPPWLQVRSLVAADDEGIIVAGSADDPTEVHLWSVTPGGAAEPLTEAAGVHAGWAGSGVLVVSSSTMDDDGAVVRVGPRAPVDPGRPPLRSFAAPSGPEPDVRFLTLGERGLRAALLLPGDLGRDQRVPVLLDPYGGPHAQRVVRSRLAFAASRWLADQGFAVLVVDGRGTPGRGPAWERAVAGDLAGPVLDDQVDALHAAAELEPRLDLDRVGIRGWSFGGYLAALAVLRRPDVFHAAVAGAPVTDWRLYDTAYTERYLGHPDTDPDAYARTDLTPLAAGLRRPLLLVHGLADDNVVAAHTLQLSRALLEAGRPHAVLPLSGVTHMTPQEAVAENLLVLQVEFLRDALG